MAHEPKITPAIVAAKIKHEHVTYGTHSTLVTLELQNGFRVAGTNVNSMSDEYDRKIGRELARAQAVGKIFELEAYLLKEREHLDTPKPTRSAPVDFGGAERVKAARINLYPGGFHASVLLCMANGDEYGGNLNKVGG